MTTAQLYRRYMKLCQEWGTDPTKTGRDLGEHIRQSVAAAFQRGESSSLSDFSSGIGSPTTLEECSLKLESLERLAANKYYRPSDADLPTSTGGTKEEVRAMISNEGLEYAKQVYESSWVTRYWYYFRNKFGSQ